MITVKLKELAEITMGVSPKSCFYNTEGKGLPFLQGNRTFGDKYPAFDTFTQNTTKIAPLNSVLMSVRAPVGDINITKQQCCIGRGLCCLVSKENNNEFLYYLLKLGSNRIKNYETGTTFGSINSDIIHNLEFTIPEDKKVRLKISNFLSLFDEKIESNNAINDNLLQQASILYSKYFQYDITDALPAGWRVGTVGEIVEIHDSKRVPLSGAQRVKMKKRTYPYYGAASLMDYVDEYIFDGKYLLLGEDGTVVDDAGYPILQYVWGQFWVNNHAHILTGKLGFNVESLFLLFKRTPVKSIVTGAVQPKISQTNLCSIQVVVPPQLELDAFNELIRPLLDQIRQNQDQNKALISLRDELLPKLISGQITLGD